MTGTVGGTSARHFSLFSFGDSVTKVRVRARVKRALQGIGNLSRYLSSFVRSFSLPVSSVPFAPVGEHLRHCKRSYESGATAATPGYYKTKDDA